MKSKLTIKQIIQKLDKIQINSTPDYIQGMKSLKDFIDKQDCYIKLGTLAHHKNSSTNYLSLNIRILIVEEIQELLQFIVNNSSKTA